MLVHSRYRRSNPSGENRVVELEREALSAHGIEVSEFVVDGDHRTAFSGYLNALLAPWNPLAGRAFKRRVQQIRPHIVHVHNLFPNISPSILPHAQAAGAKVVMTLHNYRWFCSSATAFRAHAPCYRCQTGQLRWGLHHRCYRANLPASLIATGFVASLRRQSQHIDRFLALSNAQFEVLKGSGIEPERMRIKPNFNPGAGPSPRPWSQRRGDAIFIGRLDEEKGVLSLLDSWQDMGSAAPKLDIIGSGPLEQELHRRLSQNPQLAAQVRLHGQLPRSQTMSLLGHARLLLMPSLWCETFGLSVLEALGSGVGVVTLAGAGPDDLVKSGINGMCLEQPPHQWAACLLKLFEPENTTLKNWAEQAPRSISDVHQPACNAAALHAIYSEVLE